jgi:thiamine biosynthesis lipoprotein
MTDFPPGKQLARRRFIAISAAAATLAMPRATLPPPLHWTGTILGAAGSITLHHPDPTIGRALIGACLDEVERLENIFSLYRPNSELCRLNRDGMLVAPSLDLMRLLAASLQYGALSAGAFDITVQPLYELYADHFTHFPEDEAGPDADAIGAALALVDFRAVALHPGRIVLHRPGMAVTLNGIAQGYIADRVGDLLRQQGLRHVLLDLGEIRALGCRPDGAPWRVAICPIHRPGIAGPILRTAALADQAMATSAGAGTRFDRAGRHHHLFDPRTGRSAQDFFSVTVIAPRATTADALSTAIAVMPAEAGRQLIQRAGVAAVLVRPDGRVWTERPLI